MKSELKLYRSDERSRREIVLGSIGASELILRMSEQAYHDLARSERVSGHSPGDFFRLHAQRILSSIHPRKSRSGEESDRVVRLR